MFSSNFRNKRLQYYDWWTKHFVQPVKKELRIYDKIWKIATDQNYDNATGCLIDCNYLKNYYNMLAIDLCEQQTIDIRRQ